MNIRNVPTHLIKPYENNPQEHPILQLESVKNSIRDFGFRQPIVIDKNNIIVAGHARFEAAQKLGLETIPCEIADDLTEDQINAYRILDNEIAKQGSTNVDKLQQEVAKLPDFDFSPFNVDFPQVKVLPYEGQCDEDEVPELKIQATTKPGDIWILGRHRIMCGNSTMVDEFDKLLAGANPIAMITDPPYGVLYDPLWRENSHLGTGKKSRDKVENDHIADWKEAYSLFKGDICYVWHAAKFTHVVAQNLMDCEFELVAQIIWAKNNFAISRGDYHWKHEPCWYAVRKDKNHHWTGKRDQSTLWEIANTHQKDENEKVGHGTQKPVECMLRPIENNTEVNDGVYDPFGGSGSTLIACEKTNRQCFMMEISPAYVDLIVKRGMKYSGKEAILESNGKKFNELSPLV